MLAEWEGCRDEAEWNILGLIGIPFSPKLYLSLVDWCLLVFVRITFFTQ
jgi:hypothetical protein